MLSRWHFDLRNSESSVQRHPGQTQEHAHNCKIHVRISKMAAEEEDVVSFHEMGLDDRITKVKSSYSSLHSKMVGLL